MYIDIYEETRYHHHHIKHIIIINYLFINNIPFVFQSPHNLDNLHYTPYSCQHCIMFSMYPFCFVFFIFQMLSISCKKKSVSKIELFKISN